MESFRDAPDEKEESHDITWKSIPTLSRSHPDCLIRQCVSTPDEIKFYALYKDINQRFYRARRVLTEEENGMEAGAGVAEKRIGLDVYMPPVT